MKKNPNSESAISATGIDIPASITTEREEVECFGEDVDSVEGQLDGLGL